MIYLFTDFSSQSRSVTFSRTAICSTILILNFFFLAFANLTSNSSTASVYLFSEIRRSRNPFKLRKMMSFLLGIKKRQCKKHFCLLHCLFAFATPVKLHFIVVFKLLPYVALPFTWKVSFCEVIPILRSLCNSHPKKCISRKSGGVSGRW